MGSGFRDYVVYGGVGLSSRYLSDTDEYSKGEECFEGIILTGDELLPISGRIIIEDGIITSIEEDKIKIRNVIAPCFVNSHVHVTDGLFMDEIITRDLKKAVGKNSVKMKMLSRVTAEDILYITNRFSMESEHNGCCFFLNFRELPFFSEEINALSPLSSNGHILYGRYPGALSLSEFVEKCHGYAPSTPTQADPAIIDRFHKRGKKAATHVLELNKKNELENAIELGFDIMVHLCYAKERDFRKISEAGASVVICPRSNSYYGLKLPQPSKMEEFDIKIGIGTDNYFLNRPSILYEMEFMYKTGLGTPSQILRWATTEGSSVIGLSVKIEEKKPAFVNYFDTDRILNPGDENNSDKIYRTIINRVSAENIIRCYYYKSLGNKRGRK